MTGGMFKKLLEGRLAPGFKVKFCCKKITIVLYNPLYHHGYDVKVNMRKISTKECYGD